MLIKTSGNAIYGIEAPALVQRNLSKRSGTVLDRIDLHLEVTPIEFIELTSPRKGGSRKLI